MAKFKELNLSEMNIYNKYIKLNMAKTIAFVLIILTFLLIFFFFQVKDPQLSSLTSGLATGFTLATIQFFFSWYDYVKIDKYHRMKIKDIKPDRDKREFYLSLIKNSKKEIIVLGSTATRLINDFADTGSTQDDKKALITALSRGVIVKILLPDKDYITAAEHGNFDIVKARFEEIRHQFPNFNFKYFQHAAYHSLFLVDNECILGPMFPARSSKNTPSIYVDVTSPFAESYLEYFNNEWR